MTVDHEKNMVFTEESENQDIKSLRQAYITNNNLSSIYNDQQDQSPVDSYSTHSNNFDSKILSGKIDLSTGRNSLMKNKVSVSLSPNPIQRRRKKIEKSLFSNDKKRQTVRGYEDQELTE